MAIQTSYDRAFTTPFLELAQRDLDAAISSVSWDETPLHDIFPHGAKPLNRHYEWHIEEVDKPTTTEAHYEAETPPAATSTRPDIFGTIMHYHLESFGVTHSDNRYPTSYGVTNTYDDQRMRAIKRAMWKAELNMHWSAPAAGDASTDRTTAGLCYLVSVLGGHRLAGLSSASIMGFTVDDKYFSWLFNNAASLTYQSFVDNTQDVFDEVGSLSGQVILMPSAVKSYLNNLKVTRVVSNSNQIPLEQFTRPLDSLTMGHNIDFIDSPWGVFTLMIDRWLGGQTLDLTSLVAGATADFTVDGGNAMFGVSPWLASIDYVAAFEEFELGKTRGARDGFLESEYALAIKNPRPFWCINNVIV